MTYPKDGIAVGFFQRTAEEYLHISLRGLEINLPPSPRKSILYIGDKNFSPELDAFIPPVLASPKTSYAVVETKGSEGVWGNKIDAWDILGWTLTIGAGVAAGFLIDKGNQDDSLPLFATGNALATSAFMWGVFEASFRGTGIPHEYRWMRLGVSLGLGAVTGLAVGAGSMDFNFDLAGRHFKDDEVVEIVPDIKVPFIQLVKFKIPNLEVLKALNAMHKNPTSNWGP